MADFDIDSASGEAISIGGQVTKPVLPGDPPPWPAFPANATGYTLTLVAKRHPEDTAALVDVDGTIQNGGAWVVAIPSSATAGFTRTEDLAYEVWLIDAGSNKYRVGKGRWTVEKAVGPPA